MKTDTEKEHCITLKRKVHQCARGGYLLWVLNPLYKPIHMHPSFPHERVSKRLDWIPLDRLSVGIAYDIVSVCTVGERAGLQHITPQTATYIIYIQPVQPSCDPTWERMEGKFPLLKSESVWLLNIAWGVSSGCLRTFKSWPSRIRQPQVQPSYVQYTSFSFMYLKLLQKKKWCNNVELWWN